MSPAPAASRFLVVVLIASREVATQIYASSADEAKLIVLDNYDAASERVRFLRVEAV